MDDSITKDGYSGRLGKNSKLYILKRGRKHGEEVSSTKDFIEFIDRYGRETFQEFGVDENKTTIKTIEIHLAFGGVITQSDDDIEAHFEDEVDDYSIATYLETDMPLMEYDKKKDSLATKSLPTELKTHFLKLIFQ